MHTVCSSAENLQNAAGARPHLIVHVTVEPFDTFKDPVKPDPVTHVELRKNIPAGLTLTSSMESRTLVLLAPHSIFGHLARSASFDGSETFQRRNL